MPSARVHSLQAELSGHRLSPALLPTLARWEHYSPCLPSKLFSLPSTQRPPPQTSPFTKTQPQMAAPTVPLPSYHYGSFFAPLSSHCCIICSPKGRTYVTVFFSLIHSFGIYYWALTVCQALNQVLKTRGEDRCQSQNWSSGCGGWQWTGCEPHRGYERKRESVGPHRDSDQKKLPQRTTQAEIWRMSRKLPGRRRTERIL